MQTTKIGHTSNNHRNLPRRLMEWYRGLRRIRRISEPPALRHQQDPLPPILRLPIELIVKIVKDATGFSDCESSWPCDYYRVLHSLAQVCRFFAETIKATPELWSILDGSFARASLPWNAVIRKSQSCPLIVRHRLSANSAFWFTTLHHIRRWKSDAPTLETLHLSYRKQIGELALVLDLLQGGAPNLRRLSLDAVVLRQWAFPILHGLRCLSVSHIDSYGQYSMQMLLDSLRECPELERLALYSIWFGSMTATKNGTIEIDLPRLVTLQLGLLHPDAEAADYIIKSIRAHSVEDLVLGNGIPRDITLLPPFPTESPFLTTAFNACVASGKIIRVAAGTTHVRMMMRTELGKKKRFYLDHKFRARDILEWAIPRLNDSALQISLILDLSQDMGLNIPCLSRLQRVTYLSLDSDGQEMCMVRMLEVLGSPKTLEDQAPGWLWSKLKILTIKLGQSHLAENVLHMLQKRYEGVALGEVTDSDKSPICLEELNLSFSHSLVPDMNDRILRNILERLGGPESCIFRCHGVVFGGGCSGSNSDRGDGPAGGGVNEAGGNFRRRVRWGWDGS
ncbi:hypothetical protein FRB95_014518 [Tulasnella sp. JGI-2019a]|nr:hypothetical protein FRB95_014518 [Tulasnella sp. JGI-2019a]